MKILILVFISQLTFAQTTSANSDDAIYIYGLFEKKEYYSDANSTSLKTAKDFSQEQSTDLSESFKSVPNLNMANGSSRSNFFQIRGIGERSAYEGISNYSVGLMVDEIDYTGVSGTTNLNGIKQLEVYKGPQATRFGPSAMAGMIHLKSQDPTQESKFKTYLSYESFNTWEESISYSGMLNPSTGLTLSLSKRDSDGFMENEYLKRNDTNGQDELNIRARLVKDFIDSTLTFGLHYFDKDNGYDAFVQDNGHTTRSDKPGKDKSETLGQYLKYEKDLSANLTSTTILTHFKNNSYYSYDEDWGNNPYWNTIPGWNADYDYNIEFPRKRVDFTLDQRISSKRSTIGVYLKSSNEDFKEIGYEDSAVRKSIAGEVDTKLVSIYAEQTKDLSEAVEINYGGRIEYRNVEFEAQESGIETKLSPEDLMYGLNITLSKKGLLGDLAYLKLSKGYKPGGINTQSAVPDTRKEFRPEDLYSFELGQKYHLKEKGISLSSSLFFMYRNNAQVKTSFQDDPMDPSSFTFYTDNAASGFNYGAEIEAALTKTYGLSVSSGLGLLGTRYGDYNIGTRDLDGRQMPHAPNYQANINLNYKYKNGMYWDINFYASADFYFSNSHDLKSTAYQLVDTKVGYRYKSLDISIWCKNIFDETYSLRGYYFANMPPAWQDDLYTQKEAPRSYGISASYEF
ncbi:TonB-dependent receptor plug domain-containing protein [Halobacteriovorax sp. HFRX-2_2]|uniref:TonB-dependent receptor n=1 Tax=unclassified Halobacteriovorax TaxID=2639665 RepID=UPI003712A60F